MQSYISTELLASLENDVKKMNEKLSAILELKGEVLTTPPSTGGWSVVQIVYHLQTYNNYYLPQVSKAIRNTQAKQAVTFTPGWLGDYFTKAMQPTENGNAAKPMNAIKGHIPPLNYAEKAILPEYLQSQLQLIALLTQAKNTNLNTIKIPISIAPFLKIRLGDTFRFLIAHQQRHFAQIERGVQQTTPSVLHV